MGSKKEYLRPMAVVTTTKMPELLEGYVRYLREERMRSPVTISKYTRVLQAFASYLDEKVDGTAVALEVVPKTELVGFLRRSMTRNGGEPSKGTWNARLAALRSPLPPPGFPGLPPWPLCPCGSSLSSSAPSAKSAVLPSLILLRIFHEVLPPPHFSHRPHDPLH